MGHSQSYDLKNQESEESTGKDPVRGVRRVSKEHQTDTVTSTDALEPFDYREEELREKIRKQQLMTREAELESMRIRQHESREPIIDAYRTTSVPQASPTSEPAVYKEFNYYDSLKHPNPVDPATYFVLRPRKEVNNGKLVAMVATVTQEPDYSIPRNTPTATPRYVPPMAGGGGGTYSKRTVETTYIYSTPKATVGTVPRATVPRATVIPQYDSVPPERESWEKLRAPHYDEVPTQVTRVIPVTTVPTVTQRTVPITVTHKTSEAPMVPLVKREVEVVPYPSPVQRHVTYRNPTISPTVSPVPSTVRSTVTPTPIPIPLETTQLTREVGQMPLGSTVAPRVTVPYEPKRYSNPTVTPVVYRKPTPPVALERTDLAPEVGKVPLGAAVTERAEVPYSPKVYSKATVTYSTSTTNRNPSPVVLERTDLALEVGKVPLGATVTRMADVPYSPTVTYRTPSPVILDQTHLASELGKVPLGATVAKKPEVPYSPKVYSNPTETYRTPLASELGKVPLGATETRRTPVPYPLRTQSPGYSNLATVTEVRGTPLANYSNYNTYSTYRTYSNPSTPVQVAELHTEKRMVAEIIDSDEESENVSYVTVADFPTYSAATSPSPKIDNWPKIDSLEQLHKQPEVSNRPVYVRPSQASYQSYQPRKTILPINNNHKETQYSRRPSEDVVVKVVEPPQKQKTCQVENCTHVEVRDEEEPTKKRDEPIHLSKVAENESNLKIYIDENAMEGVIDLAKDEDVTQPTSTPRRCFDEKLHYNSYFPTLSLARRPVVSFYDKLH